MPISSPLPTGSPGPRNLLLLSFLLLLLHCLLLQMLLLLLLLHLQYSKPFFVQQQLPLQLHLLLQQPPAGRRGISSAAP